MKTIELYNQDFDAWIQQQVYLLKKGDLNALDAKHLIEELEEMGKSNYNELESCFTVLIAHLLKWQYQPEKRSNSWLGSMREQRIRIARLLENNPSLKRKIPEAIKAIYQDAIEIAAVETQLSISLFPQNCPYTVEQLLNKVFYPEN